MDNNLKNMLLEMTHPIEAEFEDGFIVSENNNESSILITNNNIYADIRLKKYENAHGKMTRWSIFNYGQRIDIDWTKLPENSVPLRLKQYSYNMSSNSNIINSIKFGFEYTDSYGKLVQDLREMI